MGEAEQQTVAEGGGGEGKGEERRQRKKRLLGQIREQMEFYFSDANLSKDKFMGELLHHGPFIPLHTFFKFNRIRTLTEDVSLLRKAIKKSSLLDLDEAGEQVRRSTEVETKADEMECTIYVENIPPHADHAWVRQVFAQYGTIDYVSLPRYARSGRPKGFAFVEFSTAEMASQALEAFGAMEAKLSPCLEPSQLLTVKTFNEEEGPGAEGDDVIEPDPDWDAPQDEEAASEKEGKKRKWSEEEAKENKAMNPDSETQPTCTTDSHTDTERRDRKRRHKQGEEEGEEGRSKRRREAVKDMEEDDWDQATKEPEGGASSPVMEDTDPAAPRKIKKKKKRKRKKSQKERRDEVDSMYLKVMSKMDWKRLRNKYLTTQRQNMMSLKQQLWERRRASTQHLMPTTNSYQDGQSPLPRKASAAAPPQFVADAVVKISFEEPPQDPRKLRETIHSGGGAGVAFIDVSPSERDVFVRFLGPEAAQSYLATGCWTRMELLQGEEERQYWERVTACWTSKRNKKPRGAGCPPEPRGRDKLLHKALREAQSCRSNQHIVFED